MITETYLEQVRNEGGMVAQEFEHLYAQLNGVLSKEHGGDGAHGDVTADTVDSDDGYTERGRSVAMGVWQTPRYAAGNFTGSGSMTWTVASGDVTTFQYMLVGTTLFVNFQLSSTTVAGTPDQKLQITIPGGFTAAKSVITSCYADDNTTLRQAVAQVLSGGATIYLYLISGGAFTNWAASTNATTVSGMLAFEIEV